MNATVKALLVKWGKLVGIAVVGLVVLFFVAGWWKSWMTGHERAKEIDATKAKIESLEGQKAERDAASKVQKVSTKDLIEDLAGAPQIAREAASLLVRKDDAVADLIAAYASTDVKLSKRALWCLRRMPEAVRDYYTEVMNQRDNFRPSWTEKVKEAFDALNCQRFEEVPQTPAPMPLPPPPPAPIQRSTLKERAANQANLLKRVIKEGDIVYLGKRRDNGEIQDLLKKSKDLELAQELRDRRAETNRVGRKWAENKGIIFAAIQKIEAEGRPIEIRLIED